MLRTFHEIRRREEGQALILAAISMLILALCVLATVNLSYVASQKVRLQNAADAGAYSVAALEARAMNFFAYSNRTMVVHYASQMTMMAIMSYLIFCIGVWNALANIPYVGIVFQIIAVIITVFYVILQVAVAVAMPLLDGINLGLWAAQNGVSQGMLARTQVESLQEIKNVDSQYHITHLGMESREEAWRKSVDVSSFPSLSGPAPNSDAVLDQAIMTEIINSARNPWTAFGLTEFQVMIIPREAFMNLAGMLQIGKLARTEYGQLAPGTSRPIRVTLFGFPITLFNVPVTEEIFSVDQFVARIVLADMVGIEFIAESWVSADRLFGEANFGRRNNGEIITPICNLSWPFDALCRTLLRAVLASVNASLMSFMASIAPALMLPINFHFGQMPYARFRPLASGEELFRQPAVALMVTHPTQALIQRARPYMGEFGVRLGTMTSSNSPLMNQYGGGSQASNRGFRSSTDFRLAPERLATLPEGLQAASAAMTYYHRPGDWREPPNLFNPLWGAKLMPILDHPTARQHPAIQPFIGAARLMVH